MIDLYLIEKELINKGQKLIAGVDEVGRGPLIGPVVTAAVILPLDFKLEGLTDSKKLTAKKRELYYDIIMENAIEVSIGEATSSEIDEINILNATKLAMTRAIDKLKKVDYVLIDGNMKFDFKYQYESIVKGDSKSISIAAASVIAKVTRDRMMEELDLKHPEYGFKSHMGYPTKKHLEAIKKYGLIDDYRKTYGPVSEILNENN